ncbi:MAG: hypothetical protein V2B19_02335 [Pseudomonadota bacterium]
MTNSFKDDNQQIIQKIIFLINSESYGNWYKAVAIIQKYLPENITNFDDLDSYFDLPKNGIFFNDFLYDLDELLQNNGVDDLNLLVKRAKISRWVYKRFTKETELNIGNFRNFEADSLWELGKIDEAEERFQELIKTFPEFTYGYIHYGDCYLMSNWSYQYGPNYERAEIVYRMAIEKPNLYDIEVVKDRLKDLLKEKDNPEIREKRKVFRLKLIQERKEAIILDDLDHEVLIPDNDLNTIISEPIPLSAPIAMKKDSLPTHHDIPSSKSQKNQRKAKQKKRKQASASKKKNRR